MTARSFSIVCACVIAFGATARADEPTPQSSQQNPQDAAHARFDHGQKLYNLGKFREAIAEFEAAYELDADPVYLFALAQAHRLDNNVDRALFFYRRYLELAPDTPNREEVEGRIKTLEAERETKLAADKAAADKAVADKAAADAAKRASESAVKRVRIGVDVGWSIVYLVGLDKAVSPQLTERLLIAYMKQFGRTTVDLGAAFQLTTIPYTRMTDNTAVTSSYSQLYAIAAVTHPIAGPIWGRLGVGLGSSAFSNLQAGNPVIEGGSQAGDQRMLCARFDTVVGYRVNPVIDFVLDVTSASISSRNNRLDPRLSKIVALEGFYLGVYLKL